MAPCLVSVRDPADGCASVAFPVEDGPVEDGPVEDGPVEDGPVEDRMEISCRAGR